MSKIASILKRVVVVIVAVLVLWEAFKWTVMRVYVDEQHALLIMNKFGDPLPSDMVVVPENQSHYKGVRAEVLGPGRYFINPIEYHTEEVPLTQIHAGDPQHWDWDANGQL